MVSFENQTGDISYDYLQKVIPNLIITNLENSGYLYVVTWERLYDLLKQIGKEDTEVISGNLSFELCRMEGVENIVLGTFTKAGDTFVTDVKVLDVETKRLLQSAKSKGSGVDSVFSQIDKLSREISIGLGIERHKIDEASLKVADVTTNSLQAYRHYLDGKESYAKLYYSEAKDYFEKAIDLDPTFSAAYLYLAYIYQFYNDRKARNEALEKGRVFSENATEKERLFWEAYYSLMMENNSIKFFQILKQLEQKFPKEKDVYVNLAYYHINYGEGTEELNKAKEYYEIAYELDPNDHRILNGIASLYKEMNEYEKAIEYYKKYVAIQPEEAHPLDSIGDVYFLMGRIDEALAKYKEAIEVKPDFLSSYTKIGYAYAFMENYSEVLDWIDRYIAVDPSPGITLEGYLWKGFYNYWLGKYEQALEDFQKVLNIAEQIENDLEIMVINLRKFLVYYDREEFELCRSCMENWFAIHANLFPEAITYREGPYNGFLAWIDLKERDIESAQKRLSKIESLYPDHTSYSINMLKSEILLANGYTDEAIAVFNEATLPTIPGREHTGATIDHNIPFFKDILARAFIRKGEIDNAIAEYEKLTSFYPRSKDRRLVYPKHHYKLARLYEQKGWKGKALEHYEKFLDLWKDADPGIAEVEDARERLKGLKN